MSARILIIDDIPANVKLLEAKLRHEYYEVLSASNGADGLKLATAELPDLILLDVMMPGMSGFEVCEKLKTQPETQHIPVVMVTALSDAQDRVNGLKAGADDFLTKPVQDVALFARVRSLVRLKFIMDEVSQRRASSIQNMAFGSEPQDVNDLHIDPKGCHILLVGANELESKRLMEMLDEAGYMVTFSMQESSILDTVEDTRYDLVLIEDRPPGLDALRLSSNFRSKVETRQYPIMVCLDNGEYSRAAKALDIGVNDYIFRPIDVSELRARVNNQIRRRRYQDMLKDHYEESLSLALKDSLTGLFNRRYLDAHLERLLDVESSSERSVAVLIFDIDHFKAVNDTFGHAAGDDVLREIARRANKILRNMDLVARMGGEEFIVVLPDADRRMAMAVGERIRQSVKETPYSMNHEGQEEEITVSIGVAVSEGEKIAPDELIRRADTGLYEAKRTGRDKVCYAKEDSDDYFVTAAASNE